MKIFRSRNGAEKSQAAPLNEPFLKRLAEHLGPDATRELLQDGALEMQERLLLARELTAPLNADALSGLYHDVVGLAGHLGFGRVSRLAADAERGLRAEMAEDDARSLLLELEREAEQAQDALCDFLSRTCPTQMDHPNDG